MATAAAELVEAASLGQQTTQTHAWMELCSKALDVPHGRAEGSAAYIRRRLNGRKLCWRVDGRSEAGCQLHLSLQGTTPRPGTACMAQAIDNICSAFLFCSLSRQYETAMFGRRVGEASEAIQRMTPGVWTDWMLAS